MISKPPEDVYNHVADIANWPRWNGAILAIKPVNGRESSEWHVRLQVIGWVTASIHLDSESRRLTYRMGGKGAAEDGQMEVLSVQHDAAQVRYTIQYHGWAAWFPSLRNTVTWRLSRLKEFCETGAVNNPWSLDNSNIL